MQLIPFSLCGFSFFFPSVYQLTKQAISLTEFSSIENSGIVSPVALNHVPHKEHMSPVVQKPLRAKTALLNLSTCRAHAGAS